MNEKVDRVISITGLCIGISGLRKSRTEQLLEALNTHIKKRQMSRMREQYNSASGFIKSLYG